MIVDLMNAGEHLTSEGLRKIINIKASLNLGLSELLINHFPDVTPVERPTVNLAEITDPNWLAGFIEAEGCFLIVLLKSKSYKTGYQILLRFTLAQHSGPP